jgi:DNA gyrase subunit A
MGKGNFGSVDGDPPAAYRYTESRLTEIAEELLADIDKDTVDFVANFDDTTVEPGAAYANSQSAGQRFERHRGRHGHQHSAAQSDGNCGWRHHLVNNPSHATLADILKFVQGPDFPTGGFIHGQSGIMEAYRTGRGRFIMRAKAAIEHVTKDKDAIIVTEIPYQVNKANMIKHIAELVNNKVIDEISDMRDESDRDGMSIVIELKRGCEPQIVLNQLFKHTSMQEELQHDLPGRGQQPAQGDGPGAGHPALRRSPHRRGAAAHFLFADESKEREHVLEGYQVALDRVDDVIRIIRGSANRADARENLVAYFAGKKIEINKSPARAQARSGKAIHRHSGRRHPRIAIAPLDPALDRRNQQGVES